MAKRRFRVNWTGSEEVSCGSKTGLGPGIGGQGDSAADAAEIERYHRSMKNIIRLDNYYTPDELESHIAAFVEHYNHRRYHEALNNLTPADVYREHDQDILSRREQIKRKTIALRRRQNAHAAAAMA